MNIIFFAVLVALCCLRVACVAFFVDQPMVSLLSYDGQTCFNCRNVPGEGSCLFNSLAACITYRLQRRHLDFESLDFKELALRLRQQSIQVLRDENRTLYLEDGLEVEADKLLNLTAMHYKTTKNEYCEKMKLESTWGGGPEIVALSNELMLPIHVYELVVKGLWNKRFRVKLMARIGSPKFDDCSTPLCILCADGRFPDLKPGEQKNVGDHFQALFVSSPISSPFNQDTHSSRMKRLLTRGQALWRWIKGRLMSRSE